MQTAGLEELSVIDFPDMEVLGENPVCQNEQLWDRFQPYLGLIDPHHNLDEWCIIHDERFNEDEIRTKRANELELMNLVDRTFDVMEKKGFEYLYVGVALEDHPGMDDQLIGLTKLLILTIDRVRREQGQTAYRNEADILTVIDTWFSDLLHSMHQRKGGTWYAREHNIGSTLAQLIKIGLTGPASTASEIHHDDVEDRDDLHLKRIDKPTLVKPEALLLEFDKQLMILKELEEEYGPFLEESRILDDLGQIRDRMAINIQGLTNAEFGKTEKDLKLAMGVRILLDFAMKSARIIAYKLGDRLNNVLTIEGVKDEERKIQVIKETAEALIPLARLPKFERMMHELTERCYSFMERHGKSKAITRFKEIQEQQLNRYLGEGKEAKILRKKLAPLGEYHEVEFVTFVPKPFGAYADPYKISDPDYVPQVDNTDPMFEIYIQLHPAPKLRASAKNREPFSKYEYQMRAIRRKTRGRKRTTEEKKELRRLKKEQLEAYRQERVAYIRNRAVEILEPHISQKPYIPPKLNFLPKKGARAAIFNPELFDEPSEKEKKEGKKREVTTLMVRVNDSQNEAFSSRGIIGEEQDKFSDEIRAALRRVVAKTKKLPDDPKQIFELLDEEVLKPRFTVYTLAGEPIELLEDPIGGNAITAATRIHGDLAIGMIGFVIRDHLGEGGNPRQVSPFEQLPPGCFISIVTDKNDPDYDYVEKETPFKTGWATLTDSRGSEKIQASLNKLPRKEQITAGCIYLKELRELFGFDTIPKEDHFPEDDQLTRSLLYYGPGFGLRNKLREAIKARERVSKAIRSIERLTADETPDTKAVREREKTIRHNIGTLRDRHRTLQAREQELLRRIGRTSFNPLELMTQIKNINVTKGGVMVSIILPDRPGQSARMTKMFSDDGMNLGPSIKNPSTKSDDTGEKYMEYIVTLTHDPERATPYDLLRSIYKISQLHPTKVLSIENFQKLDPFKKKA